MLLPTDHALIKATEAGLPLSPDPYGELARRLGCSRAEVLGRLAGLIETGAIRRIGVIPNHYALGVTANGMSVWDIADEAVAEIGPRIGALAAVSHCYRRPRHLPHWRYNVFAMVHGVSSDEVIGKVAEIARLIGPAARAHEVLFSKRILKKTGLRLAARPAA
ncbi:MAG: Lrp/AsnC family transcriptional regulator [Proteobacteria bacterium]|nr:Lrp/AsnC family transcriptional regulator [Pseudomonadota bacterium]